MNISRHDILQKFCKDLHFDQDIIVEKTKELEAKAETNVFEDLEDIHFARTNMFIRSGQELRVTWMEEYDTVQFQLEDQVAQQDIVIKRAVASLLEDSRLHTKGKFLCAFGTSGEFAKMYKRGCGWWKEVAGVDETSDRKEVAAI